MASKQFNFEIAHKLQSNQNTCDKSEIQQKLSNLVKLLAREAARQQMQVGGLS